MGMTSYSYSTLIRNAMFFGIIPTTLCTTTRPDTRRTPHHTHTDGPLHPTCHPHIHPRHTSTHHGCHHDDCPVMPSLTRLLTILTRGREALFSTSQPYTYTPPTSHILSTPRHTPPHSKDVVQSSGEHEKRSRADVFS